MIEGYFSAEREFPRDSQVLKPAVRTAGLLELSEEMEELPVGDGISFGSPGGGWYEARKIRIFHEKNGILAVKAGEDTKTFRIRDGTAAEYACLLMKAVGVQIGDAPLIIRKETAPVMISPEKFNCCSFCREDYEGLPQKGDFEGSIYIGKISIGDVLIRMKLDTEGQVRARFLVLDAEALYDRTEDGCPYDNAHTIMPEYYSGMSYDEFIRKAKKRFADHISSYTCSLYKMSDKILHRKGERVYIDGEIDTGFGPVLVRSAATVLEDETFANSRLSCRIDRLKGANDTCMVPIDRIASPFTPGHFARIRKGPDKMLAEEERSTEWTDL